MPEWPKGAVCKTVKPAVQIRPSPPKNRKKRARKKTTYKQAFRIRSNQTAASNLSENFLVFQSCTSFVDLLAPAILSLEEIRKFLSAANALNHHWYPIWAFAILIGMRSGELHALTWDQIDLEKNLILVDRSYDSNVKIVGPTKGRYWRTVPLNSSLRNLILDLKQNLNLVNSGFVLPRRKD